MASSTSNLDLISVSQASKEVTANALFNATSPTMLFGRRESTSGLNWYCYGGIMMVDGVLTVLANPSAVVLTASTTNYIEATRAGVVSKNTTGFTAGAVPLYTAVTNTTTVTSYTDYRTWVQPNHITSKKSVSVTTADVTLSNEQAACRYLTITGALTGNRAVIVPNDWEGIVYNTNTDTGGPWTTTFKTSAGTGIVVAKTTRAHLFADGTNVVRITADT
jgi:hypothetical protein